jgi:hypothetical protein
MDNRQRHLRWMEMLWDRYNSISCEEQRKEEVLKIFEGVNELAKYRIEVPRFPPWGPPW